jgi:L-serine dehydratase
MVKGPIKKITIELYPELFARRAINVPAILMCGVFGADTADGQAYAEVLDKVKSEGVTVEVKETPTYRSQVVTLETSSESSMVSSLNCGGGRLVLLEARPSLAEAREAARHLGIVLVDA